MDAERKPRRRRKRPVDVSRAPKKKRGEIINFNRRIPKTIRRKNENIIIYTNQLRNMVSFEVLMTLVVIIFASIFATAVHANITNVQTSITRAQRELRDYQNQVTTLNHLLQERYTSEEIERIAINDLGMNFPDASQIINIEVHRQGTVMLNLSDHLLVQETSIWQDVRIFFRAMLDRIYGG